MAEANTLCPVCGYDLRLADLTEIVERCPSCGFEFQEPWGSRAPFNHFDQNNLFVRIRRTTWIEARMPWCGKEVPVPSNWDPVVQLQRIGVRIGASFEEWAQNSPRISPDNSVMFLQIALQKIDQLTWKPEVIEALWDGDTQGWFLVMSVSTGSHSEVSTPKEAVLFWLRGAGGDIRLFNGQMPPWPESQVAAFVGEALSKILEIPFYFPSPEAPADDYACWWERDEQKRCTSCGRYLRDAEGIKDMCFSCKRLSR